MQIYARPRWQINLRIIKMRVAPIFFPFYVDVQHAVELQAGPGDFRHTRREKLSWIETMQFALPNAGTQSFR